MMVLPFGCSITGLEAQLSPIFGLTFMELFEPALILGIAIGGSTVFLAWRQQIIQKKTTSVTVSLEMLKRLQEKDFRDTVEFLASGNIPYDNWNKDIEIEKLLTHFEDMGLFKEEGVLTAKHIKQMHGYTLGLIKENLDAQRIIKIWNDKKPEYYFIFVKKLLEDL